MSDLDAIINEAQNDEVEIDFSGAVEFDPLPDGTYRARVAECTPGKTKGGDPKLIWKFEVIKGEHKGRTLFRHTPTSGKGAGFAREVIRAVGGDVDAERIQFSPKSAIGAEVDLQVTRQKDNDEYNEIKKVKAPANSGPVV